MAAPITTTTTHSNYLSPMPTMMSPTSDWASLSASRSSSSSMSSSSYYSTFRSVSTSSSCTEYTSTGCPSMFSSRTDSISSDALTENETPPETPGFQHAHLNHDLDLTPVLRNAETMHSHSHPHNHSPIIDFSGRPILCSLSAHASIYSPLRLGENNNCATPDAGYETECEENYPKRPRRQTKPACRGTRRRGERVSYPSNPHLSHVDNILAAPRLGSSTKLCSPTTPTLVSKRQYQSRPTSITIPGPSVPVFPSDNTSKKAVVGLGLGLGLPSTVVMSPVRLAPNCVHRSSDDIIPSSFRSIIPVTPQDLLLPLVSAPSTPTKPVLAPVVSEASDDSELSPLDLYASHSKNTRHAAFCFSHGHGHGHDCQTGFCTVRHGVTTAAFLTMADHAQTQGVEVLRLESKNGESSIKSTQLPPTRGTQLATTPEEVEERQRKVDESRCGNICPEDQARGIRRFESINPYFATVGFCVTSG